MSNPRMSLTPKPNFNKLAASLVTKKDMMDLAIDLTTAVRNRTQTKHVDYKGSPFKPYSQGYAISKGVGRNNVTLTGISAGSRMLNSMKQKATKTESYIYFADSNKNDLAVKNSKTRQFFEAGKDDENMLNTTYKKMLDKKIKAWERS